ncbi:hypothetical protein BS47DRAFT_66806 [Hydnum rufescens UP504]|uniref:Uncharacterized protein n=1 Tax=Hydnum rufescens UP504 TaxID=1448309 RepID=A0A9P6ARL0_9AGAM|nr:hypothetical protein BS47DRAFT_66806 [Hydnum rufescens UP504]
MGVPGALRGLIKSSSLCIYDPVALLSHSDPRFSPSLQLISILRCASSTASSRHPLWRAAPSHTAAAAMGLLFIFLV